MRHPYTMNRTRAGQQKINGNTVIPRIQWHKDEWYAVVQAAILERARDPNLSDYDAAAKAQIKTLPATRQRPFYSANGVRQSKLVAKLATLFAEMRAEARQEPPQAPAADGASNRSAPEPKAAVEPVVVPHEPITDARPSSSEPAALAPKKRWVFWNDGEKMQIARKSRELMAGFEDMRPLEAIRKAIAYEMPADRQRMLNAMSEVKWIEGMWRDIEHAEEQAAREREQREALERKQAANELAANAITANTQREQEQGEYAAAEAHEQEIERRVAEHIAGMSFEGMIRAFAGKVARAVMSEIGATLYADVEQQIEGLFDRAMSPKANREPIIQRPARQPRVLVCGLINQQIEDVKRAFASDIDFSFVKSQREASGAHFADQCRQKDIVINMIDFTGHNIEREAKRAGVSLVRIKGSVSALKRWLSEYLATPVTMNGNGVH